MNVALYDAFLYAAGWLKFTSERFFFVCYCSMQSCKFLSRDLLACCCLLYTSFFDKRTVKVL